MQVQLSRRAVCVSPFPPGQGLTSPSPCPPILRHSPPPPAGPSEGREGPGTPCGGPRHPSQSAFTTEADANGNQRPLVSPPAAARGRARAGGSDRRRSGARRSEDLADAFHAQRGCLPRFPTQGRQAQEAVRQVLHHAQRHRLAQAAQPPCEHDRVVQYGVQRARLWDGGSGAQGRVDERKAGTRGQGDGQRRET